MQTFEVYIALILTTIVILLFAVGLIALILQYRRRKMEYTLEKDKLDKFHREELLKAQVDMQLQTMKDIGREIHDNVGQRLTLASIYTSQLAQINSNPDLQKKLKSIGNIINESLSELRSLSKSITNEKLDSSELIHTFEQECDRVRALNTCKVLFNTPVASFQITAIHRIFLQRIVQEFFQNSLKHSGCTEISILLTCMKDVLQMDLIDNGKGFNINQIPDGIGLGNIKARADLLNATYLLASESGKGVHMQIKLPLNI